MQTFEIIKSQYLGSNLPTDNRFAHNNKYLLKKSFKNIFILEVDWNCVIFH